MLLSSAHTIDVDAFNKASKHVKISITDATVNRMRDVLISLPKNKEGWSSHIPSTVTSDSERVNYISMVIAIDYRHWGFEGNLICGDPVQKKDFFARIQGLGKVRGSMAMVEMLKSAGEHGIPWHTHEWLSEAKNKSALKDVLTGVDQNDSSMVIPDFETRFRILEEIANSLHSRQLSFHSLFASCSGKIQGPGGALARLIELNSRYNDLNLFGGQWVPLLKLAQLTIIAVASVSPSLFYRDQMDTLTICPDYQVPKALKSIHALSYAERLEKLISGNILLESGGDEEVEIRLGSVLAARAIQLSLGISASDLDFALWKVGRESSENHHLCETIMY